MIDSSTTSESLREQVMIAQFQGATGCTKEQARQLLQTARWEFETALSIFFQEYSIPQQHQQQSAAMVNGTTPTTPSVLHHHCRDISGGHLGPMCAPCNTPATPPNFPEALLALQKLQAGGGNSGGEWPAASPPCQQACQQAPKVLASYNPMPPPADRYCDWPTITVASSPPKYTQFPSLSPTFGSASVSSPMMNQSNPFRLHSYQPMMANHHVTSGMSENRPMEEGQ